MYFAISRKQIPLISGPLVFLLVLISGPYDGMSEEALGVLAVTSWVAIWWISEAIPIPITSLLPIVLFPTTGALGIEATTSAYGHQLIFLYVGGFILALAIERWNLHKRIALNIIQLVGMNERRIVLGFMLATALLSMWISNTATSVMMLPIGVAIVLQLREGTGNVKRFGNFGKALMLGIAYAASIGGIATLIGTPPNLVLFGIVKEYYEIELQFGQWMLMIAPVSFLLLAICWKYLTSVAFNLSKETSDKGVHEVRSQLKALGSISYEEKGVLIIFGLTAFCWVTRSWLLQTVLPGLNDTVIAISGATLLFLFPARQKSGALMSWKEALRLPWGIILLFGGGLAIAQGFKSSGLAEWIGSQMGVLNGLESVLVLLAVVALVNFLTEITSNVATTSMILPVLAPLALAIDESPLLLMIGATLAASCAFMLPVATPPNAVVFGSGYLKMSDMVRKGLVLNLLSIGLITAYLYLVFGWFY